MRTFWLAALTLILMGGINTTTRSRLPRYTVEAQTLRFEVASVKTSPPLTEGSVTVRVGSPAAGGRWVSQNAPLIDILLAVYRYPRRTHIVGAPLWVTRTRFDIDARADGERPREEIFGMMKQLLADRFAFKVHTERRDLDGYALVVARSDRRLGRGLRLVTVDCAAVAAARAKGAAVPDVNGRPQCQSRFDELDDGTLRMRAGAVPMSEVVRAIQSVLRNTVVDQTGLIGRFDVDLEWNVETGLQVAPDAAGQAALVFTAVQEQLGLRLEPRKVPTEVLVVDHVERPTEN